MSDSIQSEICMAGLESTGSLLVGTIHRPPDGAD